MFNSGVTVSDPSNKWALGIITDLQILNTKLFTLISFPRIPIHLRDFQRSKLSYLCSLKSHFGTAVNMTIRLGVKEYRMGIKYWVVKLWQGTGYFLGARSILWWLLKGRIKDWYRKMEKVENIVKQLLRHFLPNKNVRMDIGGHMDIFIGRGQRNIFKMFSLFRGIVIIALDNWGFFSLGTLLWHPTFTRHIGHAYTLINTQWLLHIKCSICII